MKNLKGLWFIGIGLCILMIWFFPIYWLEANFEDFDYPKTVSSVVRATLRDNTLGGFLTTPWSVVAVIGLVLIGIGIYCLVRSLLPIRDEEEDE
jgi:hypothetical protein